MAQTQRPGSTASRPPRLVLRAWLRPPPRQREHVDPVPQPRRPAGLADREGAWHRACQSPAPPVRRGEHLQVFLPPGGVGDRRRQRPSLSLPGASNAACSSHINLSTKVRIQLHTRDMHRATSRAAPRLSPVEGPLSFVHAVFSSATCTRWLCGHFCTRPSPVARASADLTAPGWSSARTVVLHPPMRTNHLFIRYSVFPVGQHRIVTRRTMPYRPAGT